MYAYGLRYSECSKIWWQVFVSFSSSSLVSIEDEEFYTVWNHTQLCSLLSCWRTPWFGLSTKHSFRVCWNYFICGHIAAECTKIKNKPFRKARKFPTTPQDRVNQDEVQQASSSIKFMSINSPPAVPNVMGYKCSFQNESGDEFGDNRKGNDINNYPRYFNGSLPLMSIRKTTFR